MSSIPATNNSSSSPPSQSALQSDQISMQQFMQLLVSQLENQDPLDPMSDSDFFAQMAQLGTVQGMDNLQQNQAITEAQQLLGQTVTAVNSSSNTSATTTITGTVESIALKQGVPTLTVVDPSGNVANVTLANVQSIAAQ